MGVYRRSVRSVSRTSAHSYRASTMLEWGENARLGILAQHPNKNIVYHLVVTIQRLENLEKSCFWQIQNNLLECFGRLLLSFFTGSSTYFPISPDFCLSVQKKENLEAVILTLNRTSLFTYKMVMYVRGYQTKSIQIF